MRKRLRSEFTGNPIIRRDSRFGDYFVTRLYLGIRDLEVVCILLYLVSCTLEYTEAAQRTNWNEYRLESRIRNRRRTFIPASEARFELPFQLAWTCR